MKGTSVHIKDIMELKSSVIIRFEILLWLFGCENVSGPSRNGPLVPVSRKSRKHFEPAKPFLVIGILKTEECVGLKLCMKVTSVHIKSIVELNSSVIIRFKILLWFPGCGNFSGSSRKGPLMLVSCWINDCWIDRFPL